MVTIHGTHCAALLVAMDLPFDAVVHALRRELDLTEAEATLAALEATHASARVDALTRPWAS